MESHQSITDSVLFSMVLLPLLYNNTDDPASKFVDMKDYDYVDFLILIGATDVTVDGKAVESVNANGSSPSDIASSNVTQVAANGDNRMLVISVRKSTTTKRYVGVQITVGNSVGANVAVVAMRYRKTGNLPVTQEAAGSNSYLTAEVVKV